MYFESLAEAKLTLKAIAKRAIYSFYFKKNKEVTFEIATIYKNLKVII